MSVEVETVEYLDCTPVGVQRDPARVNRATAQFETAQGNAANALVHAIRALRSHGFLQGPGARKGGLVDIVNDALAEAAARADEVEAAQEEFLRSVAGVPPMAGVPPVRS